MAYGSSAARFGTGRALLCLTLFLAGCSTLQLPTFGKNAGKAASAPPAATESVKLVERDVEDPNVFQVTEPALWDGRPSLGGVWVAYPGQVQPERVIIRNEENKKFVIGALFKRERTNPGPKIELSSEAAAALGILAGKPTVLNVTALRRESVPDASQATPTAAKAKTAATPPKKAPSKKADLATIAAAAIDKAQGKKKKNPGVKASRVAAKPAAKPVSALAKPYIQIGIFSVESNANNTATSLRTKGVLPIIKAQTSKKRKFWRVLIGPATSISERAALLKKAHALGFGDAYFVTH